MAASWADPFDWVCLLRALCSYSGLPSTVEIVAPRSAYVRQDHVNPLQFPHPAIKVELPDEGLHVWIDPLRRPAGITTRPFPGAYQAFAPIPHNPVKESGEPLSAEATRVRVELDLGGEILPERTWEGQGTCSGTGLGAAWIVDRFDGAMRDPSGPHPFAPGWEPAPPSGAEGDETPVLEVEWGNSLATARFRWREAGDHGDPIPERLTDLLPAWRGTGPDEAGSIDPPEGPMTLTTRLFIPKRVPGNGLREGALEGSSPCGSWRLVLESESPDRYRLEETIEWDPAPECAGALDGLADARRSLLGSP
jgi:hypothetical protein